MPWSFRAPPSTTSKKPSEAPSIRAYLIKRAHETQENVAKGGDPSAE